MPRRPRRFRKTPNVPANEASSTIASRATDSASRRRKLQNIGKHGELRSGLSYGAPRHSPAYRLLGSGRQPLHQEREFHRQLLVVLIPHYAAPGYSVHVVGGWAPSCSAPVCTTAWTSLLHQARAFVTALRRPREFRARSRPRIAGNRHASRREPERSSRPAPAKHLSARGTKDRHQQASQALLFAAGQIVFRADSNSRWYSHPARAATAMPVEQMAPETSEAPGSDLTSIQQVSCHARKNRIVSFGGAVNGQHDLNIERYLGDNRLRLPKWLPPRLGVLGSRLILR